MKDQYEQKQRDEHAEYIAESSLQGEEWKRLVRSAVETKSAIFHMYENGKAEMENLIAMLQLFVGDEIRKAEERKDKYYKTEIEKIVDTWNHTAKFYGEKEILEDLEALKK